MDANKNSITVNIEKILETECLHCHQAVDVSKLAIFNDVKCPHCGKHMKVPGKLGNFTLLNEMGKGGMGSVYRARDEALGRLVAIKVILPSLAEDKDFISSFKREAQAAARVNHPHIAQIYSFGEANGQSYIVMELVSGRGLDQLIESGKILDQGLIMQIGLDIAEGLQEADGMGLIHGDIKPENILLDEKMNGKLIDFGIASVGGSEAADGIWGTPYYIAPEKLRREKADARSDIYCLGATLYHALSGQPPFDGETPIEVVKARLDSEPPLLREVRSDIDEDVERIIARMLKTDRSQRYPTYTSLLGDMHKIVDLLMPSKDSGKKSKKIIIKKKGVTTTSLRTSSKIQNNSTPLRVNKSANVPADLTLEDKVNRKKVLLNILWILLAIIAFIGISTGVIVFKIKKDKDIKIRRAEYNLKNRVAEVGRANVKVQLAVSNIVKQASITMKTKDKVISIAEMVTEIPVADLLVTLAPSAAPKVKPVVSVAEGGDSNSVPDNADETATNAPLKNLGEGETNSIPVDAVNESIPENVDEQEVVNSDVPVVILAKKAFVYFGEIDEMVDLAKKTGAESAELATAASKLRSEKDVNTILMGMDDKQEHLISIKNKINKAIKKVDAVLMEMETLSRNVKEQRADALRAKLEAEKQAQEEEEVRRLRAVHEADIASDLAEFDDADDEVKKAMRSQQYDDIIDSLRKKRKWLKTDEGKAAIDIYIDRAVYMRGLKKFLIKQLNIKQFKWGWIDNGSAEDIIKATPKRIFLKDGSVRWSDVSTKQFVKIFKYYVTDMNKSVKLVELGRQFMGVAVYCYENEAYEFAERYAYKAVEMNPRLAKDSERLLVVPAKDDSAGDESEPVEE